MRKPVVVLLCALALAPSLTSAGEAVTGKAMVRDALTIVIAGTRFRLDGVALADTATCEGMVCEEQAKAHLVRLTADQPVSCSKVRKLGHGYFLGQCQLADGSDPAAALVAEGLVLADPAGGVYSAEAAKAEIDQKGLWRK